MKKNYSFTFLYWVLLCICSCAPDGVEKALRLAGDNRGELEKVLANYSNDPADSLKLRAARYLIRYMPYHTSYDDNYSLYYNAVDSVLTQGGDHAQLRRKVDELSDKYRNTFGVQSDINVITAQYLINNIEDSFYLWENMNWAEHLDFDQFCEYLLPYKCVEPQPIDDWKTKYRDTLRGLLDVIYYCDEYRFNARRAAEAINSEIRDNCQTMKWANDFNAQEILHPPTLLKMPFGNCYYQTYLAVVYSRSKGIPVSIDFTPNWSDQQYGHYWCNVYPSTRRNIDYSAFRNNFPGQWNYGDKNYAKVYRKTYEPNNKLLDVLFDGENLPPSLNYVFCRDVTDEYIRTVDLSVNVEMPDKRIEYAYAAVFDNFTWVPVDVGRVKRSKAHFSNLGSGVCYLPVAYEDKYLTGVGDPFIVESRGSVISLRADTVRKQSMRLYRKFPRLSHVFHIRNYLKNGKIEASHDPKFTNPVVVSEFPEWSGFTSGTEIITDTIPYRYYRLMASSEHSTDFAEMFFFNKDNIKIQPAVFGSGAPVRNILYDNPLHIMDGDALKYVAVGGKDRWVGFDFGEPVCLDRISYIRRSDGNDIFPGDEYELYFWEDGNWKMIGRRVAEDVFLDFDQVPTNALFYIKCTSRGTQNRIFTYADNEARWW